MPPRPWWVHAHARVLTLSLLAVAMVGCGARPASTMPHRGGCFVQVWDRPDFDGVFDYINGPYNYSSLRDMPDRQVGWGNRIRSVKAGPAATVMLYTEENGQGASLTLGENADYPRLPEALAGTVNSLTLLCPSTPAAAD